MDGNKAMEIMLRLREKIDRREQITPEEQAEFQEVIAWIMPVIEEIGKVMAKFIHDTSDSIMRWWKSLPAEVQAQLAAVSEPQRKATYSQAQDRGGLATGVAESGGLVAAANNVVIATDPTHPGIVQMSLAPDRRMLQ